VDEGWSEMDGRAQAPLGRLGYAAVLILTLSWAWILPLEARAQLPGSLVLEHFVVQKT
jgi:hypothetical protein